MPRGSIRLNLWTSCSDIMAMKVARMSTSRQCGIDRRLGRGAVGREDNAVMSRCTSRMVSAGWSGQQGRGIERVDVRYSEHHRGQVVSRCGAKEACLQAEDACLVI